MRVLGAIDQPVQRRQPNPIVGVPARGAPSPSGAILNTTPPPVPARRSNDGRYTVGVLTPGQTNTNATSAVVFRDGHQAVGTR